jgi:uncharacterized protein (TIGR00255 family)
MTGFGRAEQQVNDITFIVEIKSLNGKQLDLNLRLPSILKPKEFAIRNILSEKLLRGSVDCFINLKETGNAKPVSINTSLAKAYYQPIKKIAEELNLPTTDILSSLLKLPEVITPTSDVMSDEDWNGFEQVLLTAIHAMQTHRANEGIILEKDILQRINNIEERQEKITTLAPSRKEKIKENLEKLIAENVGKEIADANRLEQEIVYYIEKIDIHEEQIRLKNHCAYFREILNDVEITKGKKIG